MCICVFVNSLLSWHFSWLLSFGFHFSNDDVDFWSVLSSNSLSSWSGRISCFQSHKISRIFCTTFCALIFNTFQAWLGRGPFTKWWAISMENFLRKKSKTFAGKTLNLFVQVFDKINKFTQTSLLLFCHLNSKCFVTRLLQMKKEHCKLWLTPDKN